MVRCDKMLRNDLAFKNVTNCTTNCVKFLHARMTNYDKTWQLSNQADYLCCKFLPHNFYTYRVIKTQLFKLRFSIFEIKMK